MKGEYVTLLTKAQLAKQVIIILSMQHSLTISYRDTFDSACQLSQPPNVIDKSRQMALVTAIHQCKVYSTLDIGVSIIETYSHLLRARSTELD